MVSMPEAHPAHRPLRGRHESDALAAIPSPRRLADDREAEQGEEFPMPAMNAQPSVRFSDPGLVTTPRCELRPDLAAFFIRTSREPAPRRLGTELGVLAELRAQGGYN
jgi:hypothetical protein